MCVVEAEPTRVCFVDAEIASLKGDFQEAYLLQFLAKQGAEKAQLGFF